jgi:hypothetical protein
MPPLAVTVLSIAYAHASNVRADKHGVLLLHRIRAVCVYTVHQVCSSARQCETSNTGVCHR